MVRRWGRAAVAAGVAAGAAACASLVGSSQSTVKINTSPTLAQCELKGRGGFHASVATPGSVTIPGSAAPVIVTCTAPGRRPTSYTLDASADGWIWGNSALVVVTGGAAVLGLLVDESRDAGKAYQDTVNYDLESGRPRELHTIERSGGEMRLEAE
jgi:hypothetical protein